MDLGWIVFFFNSCRNIHLHSSWPWIDSLCGMCRPEAIRFSWGARSHRFALRSHLLAVLLAGTKNRFSARYNFLPYLHLNKCLPKISEESLNKFCFRMSSSQKGVDKYYHWVCTFLCCCQFCAEITRGVQWAVSVSGIGLLQQIKSVLQ